MMRRQWPCSKCGFACSSTWRSLKPSKPVVCKSCKSKGSKDKLPLNLLTPKQEIDDDDQISLPSHTNTGFNTNGQVGMVFGSLNPQPNNVALSKLKSEAVHGHDDGYGSIGHQDHVYYGTTLNSLLGRDEIEIKQESDYEETSQEAPEKTPIIWDPKKVQKKRRSKLPQFTLTPLHRFITQLQHVHSPKLNKAAYSNQKYPKHDDVFVYEKCKFVADNEISRGAMLLAPPVSPKDFVVMPESSASTKETVVKQEPSTSESDATYSCLIDVPISSSRSE